jgi:hypothetical protein
MEKSTEKDSTKPAEVEKELVCATHEDRPIIKVCLDEKCETQLLCLDCTAKHPFSHVSKTITLESLTDKDKFLTKIKKKLEKLKKDKKEELEIKLKLLKEKMLKKVEDSFKSLEGKFESTFDDKIDSLLLKDYHDFVELFEINQSRYHLKMLKDKYLKLIHSNKDQSNLEMLN